MDTGIVQWLVKIRLSQKLGVRSCASYNNSYRHVRPPCLETADGVGLRIAF